MLLAECMLPDRRSMTSRAPSLSSFPSFSSLHTPHTAPDRLSSHKSGTILTSLLSTLRLQQQDPIPASMSSSMSNVPQQFRAAQFTKEGGDLELRETRMKDPRPEGALSRREGVVRDRVRWLTSFTPFDATQK